MAKHRFTVVVDVRQGELTDLIARRERTKSGMLISDNPDDWDFDELAEAVAADVADANVTNSEFVEEYGSDD